MKFSTLSTVALATSIAAVPHERHRHPVRRQDVDVVTTTAVQSEEAVLYVNQYGQPVTTSVQTAAVSTPTDASVDAGADAEVEAAGEDASSTTSSDPEPTIATDYDEEGDVLGYSIAYAPYNADHSCKTKDQINADVDGLSNYDMVRIYGVDCDQVPIVLAAAARNDMTVFAGIWSLENAADEAQTLADAVNGDWGRIHSVAVGNERLAATGKEALIAAINTVRQTLSGAGYEGPITTVDIWVTLLEALEEESGPFCDSIDYIAANCHPFFDGNVNATDAGQWVADQAEKLASRCGGTKDVVITESGWPSQGEPNFNAIPSPENQAAVVQGLRAAYADKKSKLVLFSAYDDDWKTDNEWGVEHYWGIYGRAPSAK